MWLRLERVAVSFPTRNAVTGVAVPFKLTRYLPEVRRIILAVARLIQAYEPSKGKGSYREEMPKYSHVPKIDF